MSAISIPTVKKIIRSTTFADAKELADKALSMATAAEIEALVNEFNHAKGIS